MSNVLSQREFEIPRRVDHLRLHGVAKFDVNFSNPEHPTYRLCAARQRHYLVVTEKGQNHQIHPHYVPCDGVSCKEARLLENPSPKLLLLVGIYSQLGQDEILVVNTSKVNGKPPYEIKNGGSVVTTWEVENATLLKAGESMEFRRRLQNPVSVSPVGTRYKDCEFVSIVVDTITNVNGKPEITSTETELRQRAAELAQQYKAAMEKQKAARQESRTNFAREVGKFLRHECGFSEDQTTRLFEIAGPGQCRDAVDMARRSKDRRIQMQNYEERWSTWMPGADDGLRAMRGAQYIASIGGVPADNKKK